MINNLFAVVNFWNESVQTTYFAVNYTLIVLMAVAALREPRCTHVRDTDVGIDLLSDGRMP